LVSAFIIGVVVDLRRVVRAKRVAAGRSATSGPVLASATGISAFKCDVSDIGGVAFISLTALGISEEVMINELPATIKKAPAKIKERIYIMKLVYPVLWC
jgi:hypothetical protein